MSTDYTLRRYVNNTIVSIEYMYKLLESYLILTSKTWWVGIVGLLNFCPYYKYDVNNFYFTCLM